MNLKKQLILNCPYMLFGLKGMNLQKGATTIERNMQIGGHKAGSTVLTPPQKIKKRGI